MRIRLSAEFFLKWLCRAKIHRIIENGKCYFFGRSINCLIFNRVKAEKFMLLQQVGHCETGAGRLLRCPACVFCLPFGLFFHK